MTFLKNLSEDKQAITLYKYNGNDLKVDPNLEVQKNTKDSNFIHICFIDLETTGTHKANDEIIEIAMKVIKIDKKLLEKDYKLLQNMNLFKIQDLKYLKKLHLLII